jgi:hypothetical protein
MTDRSVVHSVGVMSAVAVGVITTAIALTACADRAATVPAVGPATLVDTPAPPGSNTPSITRAGDALLLSWTERRADSSFAIRVAARRNGTWDSARTISDARPYFVNWADFPSMTVLHDGAWAAHWLERDGAGKYAYGIRVVRSLDQGRTWTAPLTPHTDGLPAEHGFVSLWADGPHGLGLAYLDGRKSAMADSVHEMTVRTVVVDGDGTLRHEAVLDARTCDCCQVSSAATTRGRIVVYRDRSPAEIRDIVAVRSDSGRWSEPVVVHDDQWHYPGCPVNGPAVATRGDTVTVAWFTAARDTARVLVARSVDGGAHFDAPVRVDDGNPVGRTAVTLDADGRAIVVWLEHRTPETADVRVRRIANGSRSDARTVATTSSARPSGFPRIDVLHDTLFVAWTTITPTQRVQMAKLPLSSSTTR